MRAADIPVSAPAWVWLGYIVVIVSLCGMAMAGGWAAVVAVVFGAGFSMQFWAFAFARGLARALDDDG